MSKINKWFTAWVIQGYRLEKLQAVLTATVVLTIMFSIITFVYWIGGGQFKRSWPLAGLVSLYLYAALITARIALRDYQKSVLRRVFK